MVLLIFAFDFHSISCTNELDSHANANFPLSRAEFPQSCFHLCRRQQLGSRYDFPQDSGVCIHMCRVNKFPFAWWQGGKQRKNSKQERKLLTAFQFIINRILLLIKHELAYQQRGTEPTTKTNISSGYFQIIIGGHRLKFIVSCRFFSWGNLENVTVIIGMSQFNKKSI